MPSAGHAQGGELPGVDVIFGRSAAMQTVRATIRKVAGTNLPLLIYGESGAGKEVVARLIHEWSGRRNGTFVNVNCPAIPQALLESELFGYEKGAFTGAYAAKPGLVEQAHAGTLFLDEIADLDLPLQAKLLHLVQNGQFARLGGQEERIVDVRLQCASNRPLDPEIAAGNFRRDLFYRINVVTIHLPALRERREDIPYLANYFLARYCKEYKCEERRLSPRSLERMLEHSWPGNIRELENLVKRYVILNSEEVITRELLQPNDQQRLDRLRADGALSLKSLTKDAVREFEKKIILDVLHANNWNRKEAARVLNISYRALFYKIRGWAVPAKETRRLLAAAARPEEMSEDDEE